MKEYHIANWETFDIRVHEEDETGPQVAQGMGAQMEESPEECLERLREELSLTGVETIYDPATHMFDFGRGEAVPFVWDFETQMKRLCEAALEPLLARIEALEERVEPEPRSA